MRARNIKPGFYKDEKLVECSAFARLLAPGLWMLADKEGRLADKPKQIKMEVFPADSIDVEPLLQELHLHRHILRYEIKGSRFIQVLGFKEHQSPHYSEKDSIIPSPLPTDSKKSASSSASGSENDGSSKEDIPKPVENVPKPQPPDLLNPDSLNPDSPTVVTTVTKMRARKKKSNSPPKYTERFNLFWKVYPIRAGSKFEAAELFHQFTTEGGIPDEVLIDGARKYAQHVTRIAAPPDKIAHATTYLNQRRWESEYPDNRPGGTQPASKTSDSLAALNAARNRNGTSRRVEPDPLRGNDLDFGNPRTAIAEGTGTIGVPDASGDGRRNRGVLSETDPALPNDEHDAA